MTSDKMPSNSLGDVRAEADHEMLLNAFFETPDYLTLLESDDKVVVVGRRGTGKSALTYKLDVQWRAIKQNTVIIIAPDEHHTLALRNVLPKLGTTFLPIKASMRLLWKYCLLLVTIQSLSSRYKIKELIGSSTLINSHLQLWDHGDHHFFDRLRALIKRHVPDGSPPEDVIGILADALEISQLEREVRRVLPDGYPVKILVDRLDEGFEADVENIACIDGMVTAAIDVATNFKGKIRPIVFLRDNIFRAVAHHDQDYSRNIEAFTLRLHWDVNTLFYFVANRLRTAFKDSEKNTKRLWSHYTEFDLQGEDGFKKCLTLTLYRPRDILILLNLAFEAARRRRPDQRPTAIAIADLEQSAKNISSNRLDDLRKEYRHIFPSIEAVTAVFVNGSPELPVEDASVLLDSVIASPPNPPIFSRSLRYFNKHQS